MFVQMSRQRFRRETEGARIRMRLSRDRRRRGVVGYRVEAPERLLVEALLESGRLSEAETLDKRRIEVELSSVLVDWAMRWKKIVTV